MRRSGVGAPKEGANSQDREVASRSRFVDQQCLGLIQTYHDPHRFTLSLIAPHFSIGVNMTPSGVNSIACLALL